LESGASSVEARVDRIVNAIRPLLKNAVLQNDPRSGVSFNDMESISCATGDVVARALMQEGVLQFGKATAEEVEETRQLVWAAAGPENKRRAKDLSLKRLWQERTVKTMRGPVPIRREYLYFPELRRGISPPRPTP
jgi:hypothetical protein